jgi:hypothetical protein
MSKLNTEEKNLKKGKLSLNRESLRTLCAEKLGEVVGGASDEVGIVDRLACNHNGKLVKVATA